MVARTIWCRHPGCGIGFALIAGRLPPVCPACMRTARWTTEQPPLVKYVLTEQDARFLRKIGVDPERT